MPIHTRLCDLLSIRYPIIQASMALITTPELVAAVSNAGGLGTLGSDAGAQPPGADVEEVGRRQREAIRATRALTKNPFAVGINIGLDERGRASSQRRVEVVMEERVPVVLFSTGGPQVYTKLLRDQGIHVLHAVSTVRHAKKCADEGVSAVVTESFEAGGHSGFDELTTFVLVPQVRDAVELPVVAGGGVADARALVAALALGADGVYMGTRFAASVESKAHPRFKQAILDAPDTGTQSWGRKIFVARSLRNQFTEEYLRLEGSGASVEELQKFIAGRVYSGYVQGDTQGGSLDMSASAGGIHEIKPATQIVRDLVEGAEAVLKRLNAVVR